MNGPSYFEIQVDDITRALIEGNTFGVFQPDPQAK
jgi:hypothetical protein